MSKKTITEKLFVEELHQYKTVDGKVFNTKEEAEYHAKELNDPEYKFNELKKKVMELENQIEILKTRISLIEDKKHFFPEIHIPQYPIAPFEPTTPLPAQPGTVKYSTHPDVGPCYIPYNSIEIDKMSDEELMKAGYNVYYAGHKRAVIPKTPNPFDNSDFDEKTNI